MGDFEKHVTADYLRNAALLMKEIKEASYSRLNLAEARAVLDVGCGPGMDVVPMAKLVPEGAVVTGLDVSEAMLAEARSFAEAEGVTGKVRFVAGSALVLPFADASFDSVRAERLFQVLSMDQFPPDRVFAEIFRVLKPGGYLVLLDMDWASASVDFPDLKLERRMMEGFAQKTRPDGYCGRHFKRWMIEVGMKDVAVKAYARILDNYEDCPLAAWLAEDGVRQGYATRQEADLWASTLRARFDAGSFYACANMILVSGRKA